MSPRGWKKGKPRGPASPKVKAALARGRAKQTLRGVEIASGRTLGGGLNKDYRPQRAHVDVTRAAWLPATWYVSDYQYVSDGLDECLVRALRERVVYADTGCHREPPFQDVTVDVIAAVERKARKDKVPVRTTPRRAELPVVPLRKRVPEIITKTHPRAVRPPVMTRTARRAAIAAIRAAAASATAAPVSREGKGLLQVVSEMFDSP